MRFDPATVGIGALVTMGIGVPVAAIGSVVLGDGSDFVFFFAVLAVIGFLAGGYVAGQRQPDTPMAHGAAAAFVGFAVAQGVSAVLQVARDETVSIVAVVFNAFVAANIGLLGGRYGAKRKALTT